MRARTEDAAQLMLQFAERTGLVGDRPQQRYLWTDAFAVCNFLGLAQAARDPRSTELALELVQRVHHVLGRHRGDDHRTGWISGLTDQLGETHPTRAGLRVGKHPAARGTDAPRGARGGASQSRCTSEDRTSPATSGSSGIATASTFTTSRSGCTRSTR